MNHPLNRAPSDRFNFAAQAADHAQYPQLYILKAALVTVALVVFRANWRELRWDSKVLIPAIGVGMLVLVEWIVVEKYLPYPHMGSRTAYNPYKAIAEPSPNIASASPLARASRAASAVA